MARTLATSRTLASSRSVINLGNAISFTGSTLSSKAAFGNIFAASTLTSITCTMWIQIPQTPSSVFEVPFGYGNTRWYFLFNGASGQLRWHVNIGGAEKGAATVGAFSLNTWYLACGKYDGTTISVRNYDTAGTLIATGDTTFAGSIDTTSQPLEIGHDPNRGHFCVCKLDDLRIYSSVIADVDLQAMATFTEPPGATLTARWKLDEGTGLTILDTTGANAGTLVAPTWMKGIVPGTRNLASGRTLAT